MSTDNSSPHESTVDSETAATETDSPAPDIETDTNSEPEAKSRAPPIADDPPRGATRSMGGTCPECGGPMVSRLRTTFEEGAGDDRYFAQLQLSAVCDDCHLWLEGGMPSARLGVKEV